MRFACYHGVPMFVFEYVAAQVKARGELRRRVRLDVDFDDRVVIFAAEFALPLLHGVEVDRFDGLGNGDRPLAGLDASDYTQLEDRSLTC